MVTQGRGQLAAPGAGWTSSVGRQAHNLEYEGSNPSPATRSLVVRGVASNALAWA